MRILVTGDRNWREARLVYNALDEHVADGIDTVIHGDARGADTYAEVCCQLMNISTEPHPADWNKNGKVAGPIRNQQMLDSGIDKVIAFHHDLSKSKGTADMVNRARKAGLEIVLIG